MPEDLDPVTAKLVNELSAAILPSLTKSLSSAIPTADFINALERTSNAKNNNDKTIRSIIDDNRAGRSIIMQSVGKLLDEILALKKILEAVPENLESALQKINLNIQNDNNNSQEFEKISELLNELISGLQSFTETYAKSNMQNININNNSEVPEVQQILIEGDTRLDKLLNTSLPGLEGLVKAHSKSQSHELEEFSREISAQHEQNNIALIHEVKEAVTSELERYSEDISARFDEEQENNAKKITRLMKINLVMSGTCIFFFAVIIIFMILR